MTCLKPVKPVMRGIGGRWCNRWCKNVAGATLNVLLSGRHIDFIIITAAILNGLLYGFYMVNKGVVLYVPKVTSMKFLLAISTPSQLGKS